MDTHEIEKAKKLYYNGESLAEIGRQLHYDATTIKRNLIKVNVKIRTRKEQNILSNMKRKKNVDDNFFNSTNINRAWLTGFIAADGTIRKDCNAIKIGLSSIDREILEKIKEELKIEKHICDYVTNNGFAISELEWTSKQHKDFLAQYNIVNNKSYLPLSVPYNFNEEEKLAFILGYFDGDGSISIQDNYLRFRICAHRPEILYSIANVLDNKYNIKYSISEDKQRNMYELSISTTYAKQIFKDMYALNSLKLNRKYQKFLEYINHETVTS